VVLALNMGGLERVVLRLVEHVDRSRFSPLVCALDEPRALAPELSRLGVPPRLLRRRPGLDAGLPPPLPPLLPGGGARVVHTHNAGPHLYGAIAARIAAARAARRPRLVHTKHGRNEPDMPRRVLANRFASALSDRVVAVSDDAAAVARDIERVDARK